MVRKEAMLHYAVTVATINKQINAITHIVFIANRLPPTPNGANVWDEIYSSLGGSFDPTTDDAPTGIQHHMFGASQFRD